MPRILSHNPYTPPQAPVADIAIPEPLRPKSVTAAIWLICAALWLAPLISILEAVFTGSGIDTLDAAATLALIYTIVFAVGFWVLRALARGRRWSRIVVSILMVLEIADIVQLATTEPTTYHLFRLGEMTLEAAAVILLFIPSANAWFRPRE